MGLTDTFGKIIEKQAASRPAGARAFLKFGWQAQGLKFKIAPDKRLPPSRRYLARLTMDTMLFPLKHPEKSCIVSIFTPCEMIHALGLHPYNPEGFSCYLSASRAENVFLQTTAKCGYPESLCSYHRVFLGAAKCSFMPKPLCVTSTNLVCDANQLTFRELAEHFNVPHFHINVPMDGGREAVEYTVRQLKEMKVFLEDVSHKKMDEEKLIDVSVKAHKTMEYYNRFSALRADRLFLSDVVTPLYEFVVLNILRGSDEALKYTGMLLKDIRKAQKARGIRLYWVHTIPFWMKSLKRILDFNEKVQIVGIDMAHSGFTDVDPMKPYEAMAKRLICNPMNSTIDRRIDAAVSNAKKVKADGVVWFCHWGCKHTFGAAGCIEKRFSDEGIPLLFLNGDGCDRSSGGEGQFETRLEAFLELLEK